MRAGNSIIGYVVHAKDNGNGRESLFPNADTINLDDEQLPAEMVHRIMHLQICCQSGDKFRKNF